MIQIGRCEGVVCFPDGQAQSGGRTKNRILYHRGACIGVNPDHHDDPGEIGLSLRVASTAMCPANDATRVWRLVISPTSE